MTQPDASSLQIIADQLIATQQTLLIASCNQDAQAAISYAPYWRGEAGFYIFVSEMARHTRNLLTHPQASILFIEAEADAPNLFARRRLSLDCRVSEIQAQSTEYALALQQLAAKFGEIVEVLQNLSDFHLLCLQPTGGQLISGFGQAYRVDDHIRVLPASA